MAHSPKSRTSHAAETAGRLCTPDVPQARLTDTVATVGADLKTSKSGDCDIVIITNGDGLYFGVVPLSRLIRSDESTTMSEIADAAWPTVAPTKDQEHAAAIANKAAVAALPVIASGGEPVGVLTASTLLNILQEEHREDLDRLAGIMRTTSTARHALEDPPLIRYQHRLPWLIACLVASSAATAIMVSFEEVLHQHVIVAFFIPAIVYLTDAIGTQTEAVTVRGLSLRHRPLREILWNEILTGAYIGLTLGALAFAGIWLVFVDLQVGLGVGLTIVVAGTLASSIGLLLPWGLSRLALDPAFGAGPIATIAQDVITILVYFVIMTRVVGIAA